MLFRTDDRRRRFEPYVVDRWIHRFIFGCLLGFAVAPAASAESQDALRRVAQTVEPGGIEEVCLPLRASEELSYRFTASGELMFSIHYHDGDRVYFPVPERATSKEESSFVAELNQDYCLMWENRGARAADFELIYEKHDVRR